MPQCGCFIAQFVTCCEYKMQCVRVPANSEKQTKAIYASSR